MNEESWLLLAGLKKLIFGKTAKLLADSMLLHFGVLINRYR